MFDSRYGFDEADRLFAIGLEVFQITNDDDLALQVIKSASDHGDQEAARFLARYWLALTDSPHPHIWKDQINYRKAAEFAMTAYATDLLAECYAKCAPGELDDIKARETSFCKNFDPKRGVCVISGNGCATPCEWTFYTEVSMFRWG